MATRPKTRAEARARRHRRVRKRVFGTAQRPRLCVFRSDRHIYAQIIRDDLGHTLVAASSLDPAIKEQVGSTGTVAAAFAVGRLLGERASRAGISRVVFDRGGYPYHGRVKALADGAREAGLEF
ncbi:MAG TPA: 50S ribosomal protein L18 [Bacillota bacterium]